MTISQQILQTIRPLAAPPAGIWKVGLTPNASLPYYTASGDTTPGLMGAYWDDAGGYDPWPVVGGAWQFDNPLLPPKSRGAGWVIDGPGLALPALTTITMRMKVRWTFGAVNPIGFAFTVQGTASHWADSGARMDVWDVVSPSTDREFIGTYYHPIYGTMNTGDWIGSHPTGSGTVELDVVQTIDTVGNWTFRENNYGLFNQSGTNLNGLDTSFVPQGHLHFAFATAGTTPTTSEVTYLEASGA